MSNIIIYGSDGKTQIKNLGDWEVFGSPAKKNHWKVGRSAYETAFSWLPDGKPGIPSDFSGLISGTWYSELVCLKAIVEHKTVFSDTTKGPRNHDLLIEAIHPSGKVIIGIEGKERESYDKTLSKKIESALKSSPNSKLPARVDYFCRGILGQSYNEKLENIHYQFLSGVAGVAIETKKRGAEFGMFVVQQFVTNTTPESNLAYNNKCFDDLVRLMGHKESGNNTITELFPLVGNDLVPNTKICIAKFTTYVDR